MSGVPVAVVAMLLTASAACISHSAVSTGGFLTQGTSQDAHFWAYRISFAEAGAIRLDLKLNADTTTALSQSKFEAFLSDGTSGPSTSNFGYAVASGQDRSYNARLAANATIPIAGHVNLSQPASADAGVKEYELIPTFTDFFGIWELVIVAGAEADLPATFSFNLTLVNNATILAATDGPAFYATAERDFSHVGEAYYANRYADVRAHASGSYAHDFTGRAYYDFMSRNCICRTQSPTRDATFGGYQFYQDQVVFNAGPGTREWDMLVMIADQVDVVNPLLHPQNHIPAYDGDVLGADVPNYW